MIVRTVALALAGIALSAAPLAAQDVPAEAAPIEQPVEVAAPEQPASIEETASASTPGQMDLGQPNAAVANQTTTPAASGAKRTFAEKMAIAAGTVGAAYAAYEAMKALTKKKPALAPTPVQ